MSTWQVVDQLFAAVTYFAFAGLSVAGLPLLGVLSLVLFAVRDMPPSGRRRVLTWVVGSMVAVLALGCLALAVAD